MMFGRRKVQPELTERHLTACANGCRARELADDPSDIDGMTQAELNDVINTGSISSSLLRRIL
jgi:hypothetical protein